MFVTNHVLLGGVLGAGLGRPVAALAAGIASHAALDAAPHWGAPRPAAFLPVAVADGLLGLGALGLLARQAPTGRRLAVLAGAAGGALPDLDKPAELFFGAQPFPAAVDRLHTAIQREDPRWWPVEATTGLALLLAWGALTRRGPRSGQALPRARRKRWLASGASTMGAG